MKILAFDTTNFTASVAISDGQKIIAYEEELRPAMQAQRLIGMIESALSFAKLSYSQVDCIAVTNGPGSFTGIRIGLAAAMGIALGAKIRVTTVGNFEIMNFRVQSQVKQYNKTIVLLDAHRNQLYMQIFDNDIASAPLLLDYDTTIDILRRQNSNIICTGNGVRCIYRDIMHLPYIAILPRFTQIKATYICRYIYATINTRQFQPMQPLYIKPPDCNITPHVTL